LHRQTGVGMELFKVSLVAVSLSIQPSGCTFSLNLRSVLIFSLNDKDHATMERLYIEGQEFIPEVDFDPDKHLLKISGASYHEYTDEFFDPIFSWLEEYLATPGKSIVFDFDMNYFNTASSKCFYDMLEMLEDYESEKQGTVVVNWRFQKDDLDMEESGKDFIESLNIDFKLMPYD
jgi:hypothetical protein